MDQQLRRQAEEALLDSLSIGILSRLSSWQELYPDDNDWVHNIDHGWHFGEGMAIRNLLRRLGFDEPRLGIMNLDDCYVDIVEGAIRLYRERLR